SGRNIGFNVRDIDSRAGNHCTTGISNNAADGSKQALSGNLWGTEERQRAENRDEQYSVSCFHNCLQEQTVAIESNSSSTRFLSAMIRSFQGSNGYTIGY